MRTFLPEKAFIYAGHFLAGCEDFAVGILIVSLVSYGNGIVVPLWVYTLGMFLAVLPDMDILFRVLRANDLRGCDHHQTLMHRPVIVLPLITLIGALLGWFLGDVSLYVEIFFCCVLWHYVHDTKGFGGGGIAWFWPLSNNFWSFWGSEKPKPAPMDGEPYYQKWVHPTALSVGEMMIAALALIVVAILDYRLAEPVLVLAPLFGVIVLLIWNIAAAVESQ